MNPDCNLQTERIAEDLEHWLVQVTIPLAGPDGHGAPILGPDRIEFNGHGTEAYESFHYPPSPPASELAELRNFDFCKTNRQEYDLHVCAALLTIKHYLGSEIHISSDGTAGSPLWQQAIDLYDRVFPGRTARALARDLRQE